MHATFSFVGTCALLTIGCPALSPQDPNPRREFRVWAVSCAHVTSDLMRGNRRSLARAILQSEGVTDDSDGFAWDICVDAGDLAGSVWPPDERAGREVRTQYDVLTRHRREQIYNVQGNHDAPYYDDGPGSWFRQWLDPLGEHTAKSGVDAARRPFPVEGTWERYSFRAGNVLFLMLSDRNDAPVPVGRGPSVQRRMGGFPAGAVTRETFDWWREAVLANQDLILVTVHHHTLRDTTTASGRGEGGTHHPGSESASYLCYVIENDDPDDFRFTTDAHVFEDFLAGFEDRHGRGAIDMWIAGHTHVKGPDDRTGGKSITETRWGVHFLQVAALTQYHGGAAPMSRVLTFADGADEVEARVWLHEPYRTSAVGFFAPSTCRLSLRHPFDAPAPIEPMPTLSERAAMVEPSGLVPNRASEFRSASTSEPLCSSEELVGREDLDLVERVARGQSGASDARPAIGSDDRFGRVLRFDGTNRLRLGPLAVNDWTDLTVTAWVRLDAEPGRAMRIISKDRISEPGCFALRYFNDQWEWRVWDLGAERWRRASWAPAPEALEDWIHLAAVVDSESKSILLYADGHQVARADWSGSTLDDRDGADLVIGADSAELRFGQTLCGSIARVSVDSKALAAGEIARLAAQAR
ncbi:MAG: LamG domain-containing protein [Planctomycetes bacterium]|nr:LamG domain-containing protein [Planctomycetota bacterium]